MFDRTNLNISLLHSYNIRNLIFNDFKIPHSCMLYRPYSFYMQEALNIMFNMQELNSCLKAITISITPK